MQRMLRIKGFDGYERLVMEKKLNYKPKHINIRIMIDSKLDSIWGYDVNPKRLESSLQALKDVIEKEMLK